jgi:flagellar protein FlgJ
MSNIGIMPQSSYDVAMATAKYSESAEAKLPQNIDKIRDTAAEFEAMFLSEMMNHMFAGIDVDPMFGGGSGEQMFRGMMIQEYGKMMSRSHNGIGLSDHIQKAMIDIQQKMQTGENA